MKTIVHIIVVAVCVLHHSDQEEIRVFQSVGNSCVKGHEKGRDQTKKQDHRDELQYETESVHAGIKVANGNDKSVKCYSGSMLGRFVIPLTE
jgi:hypothetical protein